MLFMGNHDKRHSFVVSWERAYTFVSSSSSDLTHQDSNTASYRCFGKRGNLVGKTWEPIFFFILLLIPLGSDL